MSGLRNFTDALGKDRDAFQSQMTLERACNFGTSVPSANTRCCLFYDSTSLGKAALQASFVGRQAVEGAERSGLRATRGCIIRTPLTVCIRGRTIPSCTIPSCAHQFSPKARRQDGHVQK